MAPTCYFVTIRSDSATLSVMAGTARLSKKDISNMVELRRLGYTFKSIGDVYGRDHTTVMHHCKKAGVNPTLADLASKRKVRTIKINTDVKTVEVTTEIPVVINLPPHKYQHVIDEKINPGKKNYTDYLKASGQKVYSAWRRSQRIQSTL